uniref:Effector protein n=1 Tax=Fusarium oxysporum f. sp. apii TaxID=224912 RepID=A0A866WKJ6_FUSOX|nr:effector protein [Fusarium oxysporum f. sp. apii]
MVKHIQLPGLSLAATAILAARGADSKVVCVNPNKEVVADTKCEDVKAPGNFYMVRSMSDNLALGSLVSADAEMNDAFYPIDRANALFPPDMTSGGFGKRDCGGSGGNGGNGSGGRGGTVVIVGGGYGG